MKYKVKCPICGREVERLYDGMCKECFLQRTPLFELPQTFEINYCRICGAYLIGKKWIHERKDPLEVLEELIKREIRLHPGVSWYGLTLRAKELDERNYEVEVKVSGEVYDISFLQKKKISLRIHHSYCDVCSRRVSGYYEAILQIRGDREQVDEISKEIRDVFQRDPKAFILKEKEKKGGRDFYVSSSKLAKKLLKELHNKYGGEVKESASLYTRKEGRDVYRMTYLLRLPEIRKGDVVLIDGQVYYVNKLFKRSIQLVRADTGEEEKREIQEVEKKGRIFKPEPKEAIVLYSRGDEVYVLDPMDYSQKPVRLLKKSYGNKIEKIRVIRLGERLYHYPYRSPATFR